MTAPAIEVEIGPARVLDAGTLGALMGQANDALSWLPRVHSGAQDIMFVGDMVDAGWVRVARAEGRVRQLAPSPAGRPHYTLSQVVGVPRHADPAGRTIFAQPATAGM